MKTSKTFVTMVILALAFVVAGGHFFQAHAQSGHSPRSIGGAGSSAVGAFRQTELSCLGLPFVEDDPETGRPGYTETDLMDFLAQVILDGDGRLHVSARGTLAWAIYPYADDITGPYDTQHERLYFGETEINFALIVDPYTPGSIWTYTLPSLVVSGVNGTFTMVARSTDPGSILTLSFADSALGHPDADGTGVGVSGVQPVCPTNQ